MAFTLSVWGAKANAMKGYFSVRLLRGQVVVG